MNQIGLHQLLSRAQLFNGLSGESIDRLAESARMIRAKRGAFLVRAGDDSRGIHFIAWGAVKLALAPLNGREKVIAMLDEFKSFGLAELFSGCRFRYSAQTLTDARVVFLPSRAIFQVAESEPAIMRSLLACLGRQFDALARDIQHAATYSARQRLVEYILRRATVACDTDGGEAVLDLLSSKTVLASRLGIAPETLSRMLGTLVSHELVTVQGRSITIHDVARLRAFANNAPTERSSSTHGVRPKTRPDDASQRGRLVL